MSNDTDEYEDYRFDVGEGVDQKTVTLLRTQRDTKTAIKAEASYELAHGYYSSELAHNTDLLLNYLYKLICANTGKEATVTGFSELVDRLAPDSKEDS